MQSMSVLTLATDDLARSLAFYRDGFGWAPVFENDEIIFYQMNGLMLGTWQRAALDADMNRAAAPGASSYALAHNVPSQSDVAPTIARLAAAGGTVLRAADAPPHGGYRGYVADPDGHAWEIAWNPAWTIDEQGLVTFGT